MATSKQNLPLELVVRTPNRMTSNQQSSLSNLDLVLEQLSRPLIPKQKWQALTELRRLLNEETSEPATRMPHAALDRGADQTLCWQLSFLMSSEAVDVSLLTLICDCLRLLWTKSEPDRRRLSIERLPDAVPWILFLWERFPQDVGILQPVLDILRSWAKIKDDRLKKMLIRSSLVDRVKETLTDTMDYPVQLSLLGLIKDLVFRAQVDDKELLYYNLIDLVLKQRSCPLYAVTEAVSAILWNWAALEPLGRDMAERETVWDTMQLFMSMTTTSETLSIHRNASAALGAMVTVFTSSKESAPPALLLDQSWFVPRLLQIMEMETDLDWRRRCMRTIRCLAACEWGRDLISTDYLRLVNVLVQATGNSKGGTDARIQACQALAYILPRIENQDSTSLGPYVETALVEAIQDAKSSDKLVLAATRAFTVSLEHSPWKRGSSCFSTAMLDRIYHTLETNAGDVSYHGIFSRFLLQLARDNSSSEDVSTTLVSPPVLSCVASLLTPIGPDFDTSRKEALHVVQLLVRNDHYLKPLAENEGLLTALVNFCMVSNGPLKAEAKQIIIKLVPEL